MNKKRIIQEANIKLEKLYLTEQNKNITDVVIRQYADGNAIKTPGGSTTIRVRPISNKQFNDGSILAVGNWDGNFFGGNETYFRIINKNNTWYLVEVASSADRGDGGRINFFTNLSTGIKGSKGVTVKDVTPGGGDRTYSVVRNEDGSYNTYIENKNTVVVRQYVNGSNIKMPNGDTTIYATILPNIKFQDGSVLAYGKIEGGFFNSDVTYFKLINKNDKWLLGDIASKAKTLDGKVINFFSNQASRVNNTRLLKVTDITPNGGNKEFSVLRSDDGSYEVRQ
jgi:uncharacterized protein YqfB (UPF0267 family)